MIQRIQTLYLLLAAILCGLIFFLPLMWFGFEGEQLLLGALTIQRGGVQVADVPLYFPILLGAATLLPLLTLLLFKRRVLQLRLCAVEGVLLFGLLAMEAMLYWGPRTFERGSLMPASFLPIAALFFVVLAAKGIFKDEMLVRSLSRIR